MNSQKCPACQYLLSESDIASALCPACGKELPTLTTDPSGASESEEAPRLVSPVQSVDVSISRPTQPRRDLMRWGTFRLTLSLVALALLMSLPHRLILMLDPVKIMPEVKMREMVLSPLRDMDEASSPILLIACVLAVFGPAHRGMRAWASLALVGIFLALLNHFFAGLLNERYRMGNPDTAPQDVGVFLRASAFLGLGVVILQGARVFHARKHGLLLLLFVGIQTLSMLRDAQHVEIELYGLFTTHHHATSFVLPLFGVILILSLRRILSRRLEESPTKDMQWGGFSIVLLMLFVSHLLRGLMLVIADDSYSEKRDWLLHEMLILSNLLLILTFLMIRGGPKINGVRTWGTVAMVGLLVMLVLTVLKTLSGFRLGLPTFPLFLNARNPFLVSWAPSRILGFNVLMAVGQLLTMLGLGMVMMRASSHFKRPGLENVFFLLLLLKLMSGLLLIVQGSRTSFRFVDSVSDLSTLFRGQMLIEVALALGFSIAVLRLFFAIRAGMSFSGGNHE